LIADNASSGFFDHAEADRKAGGVFGTLEEMSVDRVSFCVSTGSGCIDIKLNSIQIIR